MYFLLRQLWISDMVVVAAADSDLRNDIFVVSFDMFALRVVLYLCPWRDLALGWLVLVAVPEVRAVSEHPLLKVLE